MKVSILIASFNNAIFLEYCLSSVVDQTYNDIEIIIVDDASTDRSFEVYDRWVKKDRRVKVFFNGKNRGVGYTKRKCVEVSSGQYFAFVDPDDFLERDSVEKAICALKNNCNIALLHSKYDVINENGQFVTSIQSAREVNKCKSYLLSSGGTVTHFAVVSRYFYNKTEGIDSTLKRAVDQDLYFKMEEVGELYFLNAVLYNYRIHKSGVSSTGLNVLKASYWNYIAKCKARNRRLKLDVPNISKKKLRNTYSNICLKFAEYYFKGNDNRKAWIYFFRSLSVPMAFPKKKIIIIYLFFTKIITK